MGKVRWLAAGLVTLWSVTMASPAFAAPADPIQPSQSAAPHATAPASPKTSQKPTPTPSASQSPAASPSQEPAPGPSAPGTAADPRLTVKAVPRLAASDVLAWDITLRNPGAPAEIDVIDVLPHVGDGRTPPSTESAALTSATSLDRRETTRLRYTVRKPEQINGAAGHASNTREGATVWCLAAEFGKAGCPRGLAEATAVRLGASMTTGGQATYRVSLKPRSHATAAVLTNRVVAQMNEDVLQAPDASIMLTALAATSTKTPSQAPAEPRPQAPDAGGYADYSGGHSSYLGGYEGYAEAPVAEGTPTNPVPQQPPPAQAGQDQKSAPRAHAVVRPVANHRLFGRIPVPQDRRWWGLVAAALILILATSVMQIRRIAASRPPRWVGAPALVAAPPKK